MKNIYKGKIKGKNKIVKGQLFVFKSTRNFEKYFILKGADYTPENGLTVLSAPEVEKETIHLEEPFNNHIYIDDIDTETVKRWYDKLINHGEKELKNDIQAMARASILNRGLLWD